ncbi:MAG TPA: YbgC/FadM family acyl-CoA thioesterase [Croceibacterium sp.]|nr:YbgC/FadM family acyl-CoA thioesterase [Croceibacterium sp.]
MDEHAPQPASGRFRGPLHLFPVRVYYEDTDLTGIVYHANYLRWFERARSDMLRLLGIDQRAAVEAGEGHYAVAEMHIRYLAPARLDDALVIASEATEIRAASVRLRQRALRMDGRDENLLAEAAVRVGFISPAGRPLRQPSAWRAAFDPLLSAKDAA